RALRAILPGRGRTENGDAAGPVNLVQLLFPGYIQDVEQTLHIQMPGQVRVLFARSGKDGRKQIDLGDVLPDHLDMQHLLVHDVERDIGPRAFEQLVLLTEIGGYHVGVPVDAAERQRQLHSYLSARADDQYLFFSHVMPFGVQFDAVWGANITALPKYRSPFAEYDHLWHI